MNIMHLNLGFYHALESYIGFQIAVFSYGFGQSLSQKFKNISPEPFREKPIETQFEWICINQDGQNIPSSQSF